MTIGGVLVAELLAVGVSLGDGLQLTVNSKVLKNTNSKEKKLRRFIIYMVKYDKA